MPPARSRGSCRKSASCTSGRGRESEGGWEGGEGGGGISDLLLLPAAVKLLPRIKAHIVSFKE